MTRSFVAAGLLVLAACGGGSSADTVITNAMVWTGLSSGDARPGAVAIRGGKILAACSLSPARPSC